MQEEKDLLNAFLWIYNHEKDIKKHYQEVMPSYKTKALEAGVQLKQL